MLRQWMNKIKTSCRRKRFAKTAVHGKGLTLSAGSFCRAPSREQLVIGDNCDLTECRLYVLGPGRLTIGSHTTIRAESKISCVESVTIGDCVIISNHVRIYDHNSHPTDPKTREEMCLGGFYGDAWSAEKAAHRPVVIEDNVWIGEYSLILKGVRIGKGSVVAANSVVTKDVPPYSIVAGNPAVVVKRLEEE